jgi:hypothetical protein
LHADSGCDKSLETFEAVKPLLAEASARAATRRASRQTNRD